MFQSIGHFSYRNRVAILIVYAFLFPVLVWGAATVIPKLKGGGLDVPDSESHNAFALMEQEIHVGSADVLALWTNEDSTVDDIEAQAAAYEAIARVEKDPGVLSHVSWYETGASQLITKDKRRTFLLLTLSGDDEERYLTLGRIKPMLEAKPMTMQIGGVIPVAQSVQRIIAEDLVRAEMVAIPITGILLVFIFGSFASASLPLVMGIMALLMSLTGLRLLSEVGPVSIFAVNLASLLGLGLAIDYSLFIVTRFREELVKDDDVEASIVRTMVTTGRAVAFSGVTVAASLLGLFFFPQMFLQSMAKGGILVVLGTVVLALTLLPALMAVIGRRIDALRLPFAPRYSNGDDGFWFGVANFVMKRPVLVTFGVLIPMVVVGIPFLRFDPAFPDYRILPRGEPVYVANEILDREFDGDQLTPIDVLVRVEGNVFSPENLEKLWQLNQRIEHISDGRDDMSKPKIISGLFTLAPIPKDVLFKKLSTSRDVLEKEDPTALMGMDAFARGSYMRFAVLLDYQYNKPESLAVVHALRALEIEGLDIMVGGPGGFLIDLKQNLVDNVPWMIGTVCLVMFIVLFLVFGSVTLPIKAMFMNALSISASFGAIVWVFQDGRFAETLNYIPLGISDSTAPLLMFSIVFGLSMDYEVLILARIQEEYKKTGDNDLAVSRGLARTGRLITSAALLLVVVIGAFGTSHIIFMKSLGLGMALAVLLDATIVRALLVPALMKLMGDWNWWAPAPLKRLAEKIGLGEGH